MSEPSAPTDQRTSAAKAISRIAAKYHTCLSPRCIDEILDEIFDETLSHGAENLTPRQAHAMTFIREYAASHGGMSPTYDEIRAYLSLSSKSAVFRLVDALERAGHVSRSEAGARNIVINRGRKSRAR